MLKGSGLLLLRPRAAVLTADILAANLIAILAVRVQYRASACGVPVECCVYLTFFFEWYLGHTYQLFNKKCSAYHSFFF